MYQKFHEFAQRRQTASMNARLDELCQRLAFSGVEYREWWLKAGLPTVLSETCQTEEQLLNEFLSGLKNWLGGGTRPQVGTDDAANVGAMQQSQAQPQSFGADTQAKIRAATDMIKQKLAHSMQDVVGQMKQNQDSVGFQVANLLSQRLGTMIDNLPWKRGEGKFDRAAHFGPAPNAGMGQNVGDRWQQMMSTPQGAQKVAQLYSQKLGVPPEQIMNLINAGMTNPSLWPGMIKTHQQMAAPGAPAAPMAQEENPELKAALEKMAMRPTGGSATGMPMRTAAMAKY